MRRLLVPALLTVPSLLAAQAFEGTIVTQIYEKGTPRSEMVTSYRAGKTRLEVPGRAGTGYVLINVETGVWQTVMPERKMYLTMNIKDAGDEIEKSHVKAKQGGPRKLTRTGKTETVAGRTCEHVVFEPDEDGVAIDICAARGLGFYGLMGGGPGAKSDLPAGSAVPVEYRELVTQFKDGFQPLKMERITGSTREVVMQVKSIEPKSLPAAMFEIPPGFKAFDMGAMMKGMPKGLPKIPPRKPR